MPHPFQHTRPTEDAVQHSHFQSERNHNSCLTFFFCQHRGTDLWIVVYCRKKKTFKNHMRVYTQWLSAKGNSENVFLKPFIWAVRVKCKHNKHWHKEKKNISKQINSVLHCKKGYTEMTFFARLSCPVVNSSKLLLWRIYSKENECVPRIFHTFFLLRLYYFLCFSSARLLYVCVFVIRDLQVTWWWGTSS